MTRRLGSALPLILALLIGLGAGAAWRARSASVEHPRDEHSDQAETTEGTGTMVDMDMDDMDMGDMTPAADGVSYAINLANVACPVMGGETDGKIYTHWKGLRVQFCCDFCEEDFLADPEGHLREADGYPTAALEAIADLRAARGEERTKLLQELSSRFHVVEVEPEEDSR